MLPRVGGCDLSDDQSPISLSAVERDLSVRKLAVRREDARSRLSTIIVGSLGAIVVFSFLSLWIAWFTNHDSGDVVKVIEVILSPVIGIVGAVSGFYFGEKQRDAEPPSGDK